MTPREEVVPLRDGAVTMTVLAAGRGAPLVYVHSFHEWTPWSPFLTRLAERFTVFAPVHPGAPGSSASTAAPGPSGGPGAPGSSATPMAPGLSGSPGAPGSSASPAASRSSASRGFSGSSGVETLDDVHDLTLVYDELLDALDLGSPHLVGHFFGGMVAAELAALFRARPAKLVLLSPLGLWLDAAPSADVLILPVEELATTLWRDPASEAARAWASAPDVDPDNVPALAASLQRRAAMAKFVWPIPDKGLRKRLHRITAPTLLVWGDEDRANPLPYAEEWQRRIKRAELTLLRGGHMLHHESPDVVADLIRRFLA